MDNIENTSDFLFYNSNNGKVKVQIILGDDTVWATQKTISDLFGTSRENITQHFSNIFESNELQEISVCKEILHTANDGKKYKTKFYNLDAIIAIGYRVNSYQATQFRIWATKILKEYLIKGFALDDERLKQGNKLFGKDYFSELLERIREIRASERMFYKKVTDLYAESIDYDAYAPITKKFYAAVQNKLHWAIHKHTAAELITQRANSEIPHMGLTSWKNAEKGGKIIKTDVIVAKNYLSKDEIDGLNRLVNMYLDYAENLVKRGIVLKMQDWVERLDLFLQFNEYELKRDAGKISHEIAAQLAEEQYSKFRIIQDKEFKSDFDKLLEDVSDKQNSSKADDIESANEEDKKALKNRAKK
jgi:hypothetical protein